MEEAVASKAIALVQSSTPDLWEQFHKTSQIHTLIEGKTLTQWRKYFDIKFPIDIEYLKPVQLQKILIEYSIKVQEVNDKIRAIQISLQKLRPLYEQQLNHKIKNLVTQYKADHPGINRLPNKESFEIQARKELADTGLSIEIAEAELQFFKEIEKTLDKVTKAIETMTVCNAHEIRLLPSVPLTR